MTSQKMISYQALDWPFR